jgi:hypothetical protein
MRRVAARIRRELRQTAQLIPYCAIYKQELQCFWPLELKNREAKIERFAKQYGFKLRFYKRGLCAIFQEDVQNSPTGDSRNQRRKHREDKLIRPDDLIPKQGVTVAHQIAVRRH